MSDAELEGGTRRDLTLPGGVAMPLRWIPPGEFWMGQWGSKEENGQPLHRVVVEEGFWMGETPVTDEQWSAQGAWWDRLKSLVERRRPSGRLPAVDVSWNDAKAFCDRLNATLRSQLMRDFGGASAGLPSECRWEYACRAGSDCEFYAGDGEGVLSAIGTYDENSTELPGVDRFAEQHPWGLLCVHGTIGEWCQELYDAERYSKTPDGHYVMDLDDVRPAGDALDDPDRVFRGGSWCFSAWGCRSAGRGWRRPDDRDWFLGFRVCLVRGPADPVRPAGRRRAAARGQRSSLGLG